MDVKKKKSATHNTGTDNIILEQITQNVYIITCMYHYDNEHKSMTQ